MQPPLLTTLARVKAWLGITTDESDAQLLLLIRAASTFIYTFTNLPTVVVSEYSELRDAQGHYWIRPLVWPLISLQSILFNGQTVTQQSTGNPAGPGYLISNPVGGIGAGRITVRGYGEFPYGKDVLTINYTAGFQQIDDTVVVEVSDGGTPTPVITYTVLLSALWAADGGVAYTSTGTAFTKVDSAPAVGEYTVADGVYGFNIGDKDAEVTVTYSYIPADLSQAATELVGTTFTDAQHIGVKSKSLGGQETVAYWQNQMTPSQKMLLNPYRKVTPT